MMARSIRVSLVWTFRSKSLLIRRRQESQPNDRRRHAWTRPLMTSFPPPLKLSAPSLPRSAVWCAIPFLRRPKSSITRR
jgi:hypothetical protein